MIRTLAMAASMAALTAAAPQAALAQSGDTARDLARDAARDLIILAQQDDDAPDADGFDPGQVLDMGIRQRVRMMNAVASEPYQFRCEEPQTDICERRFNERAVEVIDYLGTKDELSREERQGRRMLRTWLRNNGEDATDAASATDQRPGDGEVTKETVTEDNTRSSDEETASDGGSLAEVLGLAAGALAGAAIIGGDEVVETRGDRVIVNRDGRDVVLKDENALLRRPGSEVSTETFSDGATRTEVTRPDGVTVISERDGSGKVVYRSRIGADGEEVVLIDERGGEVEAVDRAALARQAARGSVDVEGTDREALRRALREAEGASDRRGRYTLSQIRDIKEVRELVPPIDLNNITFETGSAAIQPTQAARLSELGNAIAGMIEENPREVFLIEGHTDTVGADRLNLALSDARAESVALALAEFYDVPPENLVTQGYGEQYLRVEREGDVRRNRRATVRRVTTLLRGYRGG